MCKRFVSYLRVSTDRQGASGLGLCAQREAVAGYVASVAGEVASEFVEVETGKFSDRPELAAALAAAKATRATLIVAKLDRLGRNVHFVSGLMQSGVPFLAADMPEATPVMLHVYATFAEYEAKAISERTKRALAQAKLRGVKLGNPNLQAGTRENAAKASAAMARKAAAFAETVRPYITAARQSGAVSLRALGEYLTAQGVATMNGGAWHPATVRNVLAALAE